MRRNLQCIPWLMLAMPVQAALVALATTPLATSTTSTVKPNVLLVLDNSGSMDWDHMPDDSTDAGSSVTFSFGYYGLRSSQCNMVYYNPSTTYVAPVYADGTSYADASFVSARTNGYSTAACTAGTCINLSNNFMASQSLNGDSTGQAAYYYNYSGTQTTKLQKNYTSTTNTFYNECSSAQNAAPGNAVFNKRRLSTVESTTITVSGSTSTSVSSITVGASANLLNAAVAATNNSTTLATNIATQIHAKVATTGYDASSASNIVTITGPATAANLTPVITKSGTMTLTSDVFPDTTAANLTNFANWYSYYRTRMLMMKTATGRAFSSLNNSYRVGLMTISNSSSPVVALDTFAGTQRSNWYSALYSTAATGSTPLRTALANAGRYYAGKLSGIDPLQYSCQQNFSILSTDGYWNTGDGFKLDGSTLVGNQDGAAGRPMLDGTQANTTVTTTYTRNNYSTSSTSCGPGKKRLINQPQIETCSVTITGGVSGAETCTAWSNNGASVYVAPYTSSTTTCAGTVTLPTPNPSTRVVSGTPVTTPGNVGGSSDSLSDIAMYYYQTDLRTPALSNCGTAVSPATVGQLCDNNVLRGGNDQNLQQHMTTFTLGLGSSGMMKYSTSYLSDSTGDYPAVKLGLTADSTASPPVCSWQANGTVCNWPLPGISGTNGLLSNIDDLWHAAVDGHGAYFSATDPVSLSEGLSNALAGIKSLKGSAAAAATSTLNPVAGNNYAFVASYTTVTWKGNLEERGINVDTAVVSENANWCVENIVAGICPAPGSVVSDSNGSTITYNCVTPNSVICTGGVLVGTDCKVPVATVCTGTMGALVSDSSDTRIIKTSSGSALINFDAAYATANPTYFSAAQIGTLSQWSTLTAAQQTVAAGVNLINYLRGQYGHEYDRTANTTVNQFYRYREAIMGDALESQPAYMGNPVFSYPYAGYSAFVTAQANRSGTVYMGANDGMMHAFSSDTGVERWAYVPSMVIPNMWKLADTNYATLHTNYVNGSPITSDIYVASSSSWKTILVAGLNAGGRGYFALDITDPTTPVLLWEFTTTSGIGTVKDDDLGYSFGQPVITRKADGTWVVLVTSGYNNVSPGSGKGYLYVLNAATGAIISKISSGGVGSTTTPNGFAKIAGWNNEPAGNAVGYVYGGDLLGNVWRFDINSTVPATIGTGDVLKFATLYSDVAGVSPQPITTTPILGKIAGKRIVFIGTGKYLESSDLTNGQVQTQYAIKDDDATSTLNNPRNTLVHQTLNYNPDGTATRITSGNAVNFYTGRGWYANFPDNGERTNIDSELVQGTLIVPTTVPSNTVCTPGGYGWLNYFDYRTGNPINTATDIVSMKYDATIVGINMLYTQGVPKVGIVTSTNPTPQLNANVGFAATAAGFSGKRVLWRELIP